VPRSSPTVTAAATTTTATASTAITAAVAAATKATAAATTAAARAALLGDVNAEGTTFKVLAIEVVERLLRAFRRGHLDEAETARAARHPVEHQSNLANFTAGSKTLRNQIFGGVKREVTNVQTIRHFGHFSLAASKHTTNTHKPQRGRSPIALYENASRV
jgi:hypothetical protein